jgi:hypothetical protein
MPRSLQTVAHAWQDVGRTGKVTQSTEQQNRIQYLQNIFGQPILEKKMPSFTQNHLAPNPPVRRWIQSVLLVATMTIGIAGVARAGETAQLSTPKHFGAGIDVRTQPRVEDTGLPLYPGAVVERSERDEKGREELNDGVNFDLWFGGFGLKLVVVKLKTDDSAEKVSAYYRNALAKYGEILDCSDNTTTARRNERRKDGDKSAKLTCDDFNTIKAKRGDGEFYKSGIKQKQYGVAIQSQGDGAKFQLLHFEKRGNDD